LKLSLEQLYGRYHELGDRYDISIPQMAIDCFFSFYVYFAFLHQRQHFTELDYDIIVLAITSKLLQYLKIKPNNSTLSKDF
jgi:hypothetical protein